MRISHVCEVFANLFSISFRSRLPLKLGKPHFAYSSDVNLQMSAS